MSIPLRILHLDCTMGKGGQERDHIHEALEFIRRGHSYVIAARPESELFQMAKTEGIAFPVPMRSNFDLKSFMILRRFLQERKTDVLVTTSYIDSVLGWFAAISLGRSRPLVIRQRHILNPPKRIIPYRYFCDYLVAVSDIARFGYIERGIPFWRVVSIPRGILEPVIPQPDASPSLPEIPDGSRIILQVGTLQRDKGQLPLMEAMKAHLESHPSLHLVILGDGPLSDNLRKRREMDRFRRCREQIHLPGWKDPAPYYRRATVTVVSSFRESFSLVALESLYHGVPVVGFRQGGLPQAFSWAQWGELVDPWNFEELSQRAVNWGLRADLSCATLGKIREIFRKDYSIGASVTRTEEFYRWGIARKRLGRSGVNSYALVGGLEDPFISSLRGGDSFNLHGGK